MSFVIITLIGLSLMFGIIILGWLVGILLDWQLGTPEEMQEAMQLIEEIEQMRQDHAAWEKLLKENPEQAIKQVLKPNMT